MDTIPLEILELILYAARLSRQECINNRTVCRAFSTVLTPIAFHTVRTNRMARESFDRLCSIAQSPELAKHVVEFHYNIEELLTLRSQHEVDIILYALPEQTSEPPPPPSPDTHSQYALNAVDLMTQVHHRHQKFLKQQDILGTFYDTISMYQSLPLFHNLRKIHIKDLEPSTTDHSAAFARAFWNIVKVMAIMPAQSCPNFDRVEFDRFHYEALAPLLTRNSINHRKRLFGRECHRQVEAFMKRVVSFKINDFSGSWLSQVDVDGRTLGTLREIISQEGIPLRELVIHEEIVPRPTDRWKETFFLWSHDSRQYESTMVALTIPPPLFSHLRRLDLRANKLLNSMYFTAMLIQLPPNTLEEMTLDSLGFQGQTTWVNFFRIISPKLLWTDDSDIWRGALKHWSVQRSVIEELEGALDTLMLSEPGIAPDNLRAVVWKGLRLKKCKLYSLVNHSPYKGVTSVTPTQLEQYERWMTEGLEEAEYRRYSHERNFPDLFRDIVPPPSSSSSSAVAT